MWKWADPLSTGGKNQFFSEDLRDPLVVVAAQMCFKDVLAVYAGINEGVINMLEHYFEMAKTDASRALELYRRFVSQTEKVVAYLGKSRSVSSSLGFQVPKLRHAPTGLATALQEYLDDPNFEQNRLEYKESKRIADGGAPSKPSTTTTSSAPSKPADSGTSAPPKDEPPAPKPPTDNQAVQDFFASIDTNPTQSTFAVPQDAFTDMYGGMYAMPPGGSYDPNFGVNPMMTGMQPQATGYNPFAAPTTGFVGAQPTGFQQPQPTGFPQQQPFDQAFNQPQQPSQITAQQTGTFNPFRPGAVGTQAPVGAQQTGFNNGVVPQVTGFAYGNTQYPQPTGVPPQQTGLPPQQTGIQQQQTGAAPGPNPAHLPPVRDTKSPPPARSAGSAKPLVAQKTGSRNPFAPPGGVPSPPPSRPTLPTLSELAEQGVSNKYGLGADGWDGSSGSTPKPSSNSPFGQSGPSSSAGLQPQATGLLGNVASEFTQSGQANLGAQATGFGASQAPQSQAPQPSSTGVGQQDLSGQLGNLSLNNNNQLGSQSTGLAPQPTGNVQPFKPSSAFGASLTGQPTGQQPTSHFGSINPQMTSTTGNPFGASQSAAPSSGLGSSLSSQPTGFGLGSQPTGLGTGLSSQATGAPGLSLNTQPTGLNSGLGSGPGSGLGSAGPTSSPLNAQPTGVSGSSVKPFQPSSAFGQSQFGQPGAQPTGQSTQQRSTTFGTLI